MLKWLFPFTLGCIVAIGGLTSHNLITKASEECGISTPIVLQASTHSEVVLKDEKLARVLRNLLNKSENARFYADDFLTNENFKPVTDTTTGTTSAPTYQLDLSNTGITDIRELSRFIFPTTLQGINLSGNGITNNDLNKITTLVNATTSSSITISGEDTEVITPACNFSSIVKKVNLNNNNIDLSETSSTYLNNTKLLFGIQNFGTIDSSGFVKNGEMKPMYYLREDDGTNGIIGDEHYVTMAIFFEYSVMDNIETEDPETPSTSLSPVRLTYNKPTYLLDFNSANTGSTYKYGKVSLSLSSTPSSSTAYFSGYSFTKEFTLFEIKFKDSFTVERGNLINLHLENNQLTTSSPLIIEGLGKSLIISYENPRTDRITTSENKNLINISLTYRGKSRTIPVEFVVKDTIPPVIKLIGSSYAYCSRNKNYNDIDPGVIAYDPVTPNGIRTEENALEWKVIKTKTPSNYDYSQLGVYTITYKVRDDAGLEASVTRTVEVQERVLDTINLRCNTEKTVTNEDITFVVQPDSDVVMSNYKNITYEWYVNDQLQQTTKGNTATGKSTTTLNFSQIGEKTIKVKIKAIQIADNVEIEFFSNVLTLDIQPQLRNGSTLILGASIAIIIVLIIICVWAINNKRKSKNTSGRHKNFHKGKTPKDKKTTNNGQPEIQVIKNYNGTSSTGDTGTGSNGEGGGNSNFRPPENGPNDRSL